MRLRGRGRAVRRLSPCTISQYLRNTEENQNQILIRKNIHKLGECRQTIYHLPYYNIYPICDLLITLNYREKYRHSSSSRLSFTRYHSVSYSFPCSQCCFYDVSLLLMSRCASCRGSLCHQCMNVRVTR